MKNENEQSKMTIKAIELLAKAFESIAGQWPSKGVYSERAREITAIDGEPNLLGVVGNNSDLALAIIQECVKYKDHITVKTAVANAKSYTIGPKGFHCCFVAKQSADNLSDAEKSKLADLNKALKELYSIICLRKIEDDIVSLPITSGEIFIQEVEEINSSGVDFRYEVVDGYRVKTPEKSDYKKVVCGVVIGEAGSIIGYYVDGEFIDSKNMRHWRYNVNSNKLRGCPEIYPLVKEKVLQNISKIRNAQCDVTILKARIPGVASYSSDISSENMGNQLGASSDATYDYSQSGGNFNTGALVVSLQKALSKIVGGTQWLFVPEEYEFNGSPFQGASADDAIKMLKMLLESCSALLGQPYYMLAGSQDNTGFGSSGMKTLEDGQAANRFKERERDAVKVIESLIVNAIDRSYKFPEDWREYYDLSITGKQTRSDIETKIKLIKPSVELGIMSDKTAMEMIGLNPEIEMSRLEQQRLNEMDIPEVNE